MRRMIAGPLLFGSLSYSLNAQNPTSPPAPTSNTVIRTNVNLVQIDAIVMDREGQQVTTLAADDFRVLQDGKAYNVRNCSYVSTSAPGSGATSTGTRGITQVPGSDIAPQPAQVRRSIAFLVDDLALSFDSVARLRTSLRRFVDKEMRDGLIGRVGVHSFAPGKPIRLSGAGQAYVKRLLVGGRIDLAAEFARDAISLKSS